VKELYKGDEIEELTESLSTKIALKVKALSDVQDDKHEDITGVTKKLSK
jgi:hypothetical protein